MFWNRRSLERSFCICLLLRYLILLSLLLLQFSRGFTLQNWSHFVGGLLFCLLFACLDSILNCLNSPCPTPCCGTSDPWREVRLCPPPTLHWERAMRRFYQKHLLEDFLLQPTEELLLAVFVLAVCRGEGRGKQAQTSYSINCKTPYLSCLNRTKSYWITEIPNLSYCPGRGLVP